jgi:hypothetical protein
VAESMRNPKLLKILYEQRIKTFDIVRQYLDLQEEKGFFRKVDTEAIVSLYDGLDISNFMNRLQFQ